ncbi:MAG: hypothetical protein FWE20_00790 [Defluviitaleaceae bacterium]|nr:hypothetical protein [Defluviitaleaceae bacterium]
MKQSYKLDEVCIERILRYIKNIHDAYMTFKITSADELASNDLAHLAITQIITNIYELRQKISADTLAKVPLFDKIGLKAARNIASHDYDSLDFDIIYRRTQQLIKPEIYAELERVRDVIKRDRTSDT